MRDRRNLKSSKKQNKTQQYWPLYWILKTPNIFIDVCHKDIWLLAMGSIHNRLISSVCIIYISIPNIHV